MEIDKIEQMVYALDRIIDRYIDREMNQRIFSSLLNEISNFYRNMLFPYCGHSMSEVVIRNELIEKLGETHGGCVYRLLF